MAGFGETRKRRLNILGGALIALVFVLWLVQRLGMLSGRLGYRWTVIATGVGALLLLVGGIVWVVMLVQMIRQDMREHERNMAAMERRRRELEDKR